MIAQFLTVQLYESYLLELAPPPQQISPQSFITLATPFSQNFRPSKQIILSLLHRFATLTRT